MNDSVNPCFQVSGVLTFFFFSTKVTLPSSKNLKLSSETKTHKGLFSDEEDSEVRNSFS